MYQRIWIILFLSVFGLGWVGFGFRFGFLSLVLVKLLVKPVEVSYLSPSRELTDSPYENFSIGL